MSRPVLKVFISSTSTDLRQHREKARDIVLALGFMPIMMENFPAMDANAVKVCRDKVYEADLFVGIYAHRYGYIPQNSEISITEMEFNWATERGIPRLCFLVDPAMEWLGEVEQGAAQEKLLAFKSRLNTTLVRANFDTPDSLAVEVSIALQVYRSGQPAVKSVLQPNQAREMQAAMPKETRLGNSTEVWVKIALPDSTGLRGELPAEIASGDVIQKGDVHGSTFTLTFPKDRKGQLKPINACLKVSSPDFDVTTERGRNDACEDDQVSVEISPEHDSRTVIFNLNPKAGLIRTGRSRVTISLYQEDRLIAQTSINTELIDAVRTTAPQWNFILVPVAAGAYATLPDIPLNQPQSTGVVPGSPPKPITPAYQGPAAPPPADFEPQEQRAPMLPPAPIASPQPMSMAKSGSPLLRLAAPLVLAVLVGAVVLFGALSEDTRNSFLAQLGLLQPTATPMDLTLVPTDDGAQIALAQTETAAAIPDTTTPSYTPSRTPSRTPSPTDMPSATATPSRTPSPTELPSATPTDTPEPTEAPTDTPTATDTRQATISPTPSPTVTDTPTNTYTPTATLTATDTPTATNTPTATDTPTPTATPSATERASSTSTPSATPLPLALVVGSQNINLRREPSTSAEVVTLVAPNTPVSVIGEDTTGEWLNVRLVDGTEGWISASLLDVIGVPTAAAPVVDGCPEIVQQALTLAADVCPDLDRDMACLANGIVITSPDASTNFRFFQPGDQIELESLTMLSLTTDAIVVINASVNLPAVLPGQSVTILLIGVDPSSQKGLSKIFFPVSQQESVILTTTPIPNNDPTAVGQSVLTSTPNTSPTSQQPTISSIAGFYLTTGIGSPACNAVPTTISIQGPTPITMTVLDTQVGFQVEQSK